MTSSVYNPAQPLVAGSAYTFTAYLADAATPTAFKSNPTFAAGDVKISIDGGSQSNIANLPSHIALGQLSVTLTAGETTGATKNITVTFHDAAGAEWLDAAYVIEVQSAVTVGAADAPSAATIAAAVWNYLTSAATTVSSLGKLIVDYLDAAVSSRMAATSPVVTTIATTSGSTITILRGDTMVLTFTDLGTLANRSKLYFTVKEADGDADSESVIQIEYTAGLLYINKAAAGTSANGSMTISHQSAGDITVTLAAAEVAKLAPKSYLYDVQLVRSAGVPVSTLTAGAFVVSADVTRGTA